MEIIVRNFLRLLRAGLFKTNEQIEPMSEWKWNQVYQLAIIQDVAPQVRDGIQELSGQFFLQIPPEQMQQWNQVIGGLKVKLIRPRMINRFNEKRLTTIIKEENGNTPTLTALFLIASTAHHILNDGLYLHDLIALACLLRQPKLYNVDYDKLNTWLFKLRLKRMAQLEASMLVSYLEMSEEEIHFAKPNKKQNIGKMYDEFLDRPTGNKLEWHFSQANNIFVHTSNASGMAWQARRSAKYFKYSPKESITNLISVFVHSLTHIEE